MVQTDNDIVISGISGRLPESSTIEEFKKNLFSGVDMVTNRLRYEKMDLPKRCGMIPDFDLNSFDNEFFQIRKEQVESTDPCIRLLLQATFEAIVDAGK